MEYDFSIIEDAKKLVLQIDRAEYEPIFEVCEKFISRSNYILSGQVGLDLLMKKPMHPGSFTWEIYIDNPLEEGKRLLAEISKRLKDDARHLSKPENQIVNETSDFGKTSDSNAADSSSKADSTSAAADSTSAAADSTSAAADAIGGARGKEPLGDAKYDSLYMQTVLTRNEFNIWCDTRLLIKIFRLQRWKGKPLYSGITCDGYYGNKIKIMPPSVINIEIYQKLYNPKYYSQWDELREVKQMIGGAQRNARRDTRMESAFSDKILIGDYALAHYIGLKNKRRLQFISGTDIAEIAREWGATWKEYNHTIPSDFQLRKYTVYKGEKALFDVYNSTTYELIPWQQIGKDRIAMPEVVIRFLYIEKWVWGVINPGNDTRSAQITAMTKIKQVDQRPNYSGVHIDPNIAKKKIQAQEKRHGNIYAD